MLSVIECFNRDKGKVLSILDQGTIKISDILNSDISLENKNWFIFRKCDLTLVEKQRLALNLVWTILPIFEEKFTNDNRIRRCLETAEKHLKGEISKEELIKFKDISENIWYGWAWIDWSIAWVAAATTSIIRAVYPDIVVSNIMSEAVISAQTYSSIDHSIKSIRDLGVENNYKEKFLNEMIEFFK